MTPKQVLQELRRVQQQYKDKVTPTFDVRISDMAKDAADTIESLLDFINSLPTCNTCNDKECKYRSALGDAVRYNCMFFTSGKGS